MMERKKTAATKRRDVQSKLNQIDLNNLINREEFIKQIDVIDCITIIYNKPIAIIYNPNSGKKLNVIDIITDKLNHERISHAIF